LAVRCTSNLSKAHEMHDSLWLFLFGSCPGLSPSISLQLTVDVCPAEIAEKSLKPLFWEFKIVQGH